MKSLQEISKDAEKCANLKNSTNRVKCLKKMLITEIDGDKDILLCYRAECKKNMGFDSISFALSVSAFIISLINFANIIDKSTTSDSLNEVKLWEVIFSIFLIACIIIIIVYVAYSSIKYLFKQDRYKVLDVVLQDISDNWDEINEKS